MPAAPKIPHYIRDLNDWSGITNGQVLKRNGTAVDSMALGDAAAKNTGTTAGTVAAGDDSRFTQSPIPLIASIWG